MPVISLIGTTSPATMLAAVGSVVGSVWDSYYLFFAFAAGLSVAFALIAFVLSLVRGRARRS